MKTSKDSAWPVLVLSSGWQADKADTERDVYYRQAKVRRFEDEERE